MNFRSILLQILFTSLLLSTSIHAQNSTTDDEVQIDDIGRLPESFDMALDSLLSNRYKQYYSLSKPKRPMTPAERSRDALYRERVRSMESGIPLSYNSIVREAIDLYVHNRSTLISTMLAKSSYYFPMIEEALDRHRLPLELKYLAIVESALEPNAVSRMGATGLWQFMLRTGKIYGLKVDSVVDERRDPRKSTEAMCLYFKDMYALYGDWLVAIAAYNCGPGNMNKAIRRAGGSRDFWAVYPYLPRETRSYVPFFIAAFYAMEYYKEHDIRPQSITLPLATDTVHIHSRLNMADIARVSGVSMEMLHRLNPQYHKDIVPGNQGTQILVMPAQEAIAFAAHGRDSLGRVADNRAMTATVSAEYDDDRIEEPKERVRQKSTRYHKVKKGETLSSIAKKYRGVTVNEIKKANGLKSSKLKVGQRLKIPN